MAQRVLMTGGTGHLGRHLVPRLQDAGTTVRITSRRPRPDHVPEPVEWAQLELGEPEGYDAALADVDVVVHAASTPFRRGVDSTGTRHLLAAAQRSRVRHLVYISIVGVEKFRFAYYQEKLACERLIESAELPYSILRATQFHGFVYRLLDELCLRWPVAVLPRGWQFQTIDAGEVAGLLLDAVQQGPGGRLPDAGGPEVLRIEEMADVVMQIRGRKPVLRLPVPFGPGAGFRRGDNLVPERRVGKVTWREWVTATLGERKE